MENEIRILISYQETIIGELVYLGQMISKLPDKLRSENDLVAEPISEIHLSSAPFSNYKSHFNDWDYQASVRAKPSRDIEVQHSDGQLYFSPDLVPISKHPLIQARSLEEEILKYHLFSHLEFTSQLEHNFVNEITREIATGSLFSDAPREIRLDASRIYCDEAYHALFSIDLQHQVADRSREGWISKFRTDDPAFTVGVKRLQQIYGPEARQLIGLFFVIVSETLISRTLSMVPKDARVMSCIREAMHDHAIDEGRHHAFFVNVMEWTWPQLSLAQKRIVGPLLVDFIAMFLDPNLTEWIVVLKQLGFTNEDAQMIVHESFPVEEIIKTRIQSSKATIALFNRLDVMSEPITREAFMEKGYSIND